MSFRLKRFAPQPPPSVNSHWVCQDLSDCRKIFLCTSRLRQLWGGFLEIQCSAGLTSAAFFTLTMTTERITSCTSTLLISRAELKHNPWWLHVLQYVCVCLCVCIWSFYGGCSTMRLSWWRHYSEIICFLTDPDKSDEISCSDLNISKQENRLLFWNRFLVILIKHHQRFPSFPF